ncbi:polysaccharide pyruvyl transferase family protein [Corynebacterium hansenii]|uniref:Polysaccharide pyruvyl transferase family protein n=1 Tax=Corynebacterium hansenii TaxID=394964 RepID=A0ABV7ZU53_9CORY|nr:polysaccharide pyruvyl transferase family protein [Corynebacterium hansenii]WJZ01245.1 Polysaccharide pyruvyl transferase [Corynebacterium hansenii]
MSAHDDVIYLVAPTGHPNFGDEYIAAAWLRTLARRRPRARVVLDCPHPGMVGVLHAGLHPNLTATDTLFRLAEAARAGIPDDGGHWLEAARRAEVAAVDPDVLDDVAPRLEPGLDLLYSASTIHALGGGWVNDIWPDKSVVLAAASAVAERSRAAEGDRGAVRLLATGMGLVPAGLHDETMHRIWPRFDLIDVRDADSLYIARAALGGDGATRVTCTGDDAWTVLGSGDLEDNGLGDGLGHSAGLDALDALPGIGDGRVLGIELAEDDGPGADVVSRPIVLCLQGDLLAGEEDPVGALADAVIAALRGWDVDGRPVAGRDLAVIEAIPGADAHVWREVARRAPDLAEGALFVRFAELWDRGLPARAGQRWLTTRFHPHLIAAARGASGVALDVHVRGYYSVKHASVAAAGSGWPVVSLDDVAGAEPGPGISPELVERNREAKAETVEEAYPVSAVVEGLTTAAVKGRRAGLGILGLMRRL